MTPIVVGAAGRLSPLLLGGPLASPTPRRVSIALVATGALLRLPFSGSPCWRGTSS